MVLLKVFNRVLAMLVMADKVVDNVQTRAMF